MSFPLDPDYDYEDLDWVPCETCGGGGCIDYDDAGPEVWGEDCPSEENHLVLCPGCYGSGGWSIPWADASQPTNPPNPSVPGDADSKKESK